MSYKLMFTARTYLMLVVDLSTETLLVDIV